MKKIFIAITLSSVYLLIYAMTAFANWSDRMVLLMFTFSPLVIIYLVYTVLKNGKPSPFTFDERFYEDHDYIRNGKEAEDL